ncbi:hypothetical protein OG417_41675 [Actinoallomurus sp. NBC_01490]|uniref:glycoside hydrolase family 2 protein n=1 Tax=Actinoallomurus sp. NBC_01490 TaxID=2903557 RepID=UPI002E2F0F58|nr:glycoside hydrolase family 2 TIM barrel-domain containing protein [Actinoallomurus sp. NBC_01490]
MHLTLDGTWDLIVGDPGIAGLADAPSRPVTVPGLWEAEVDPALDGVVWYRRAFDCPDPYGRWTLRFGAVMDVAEVYLNGVALGGHVGAFTPFEIDPGGALVAGENVLAVRVTDHALDDPEHPRTAHGKQGWANHAFPSPPSLYLTYGGIWQPVTLRRHGPVAIDDVFVNGDPADLAVAVELSNRSADTVTARVRAGVPGDVREAEVLLPPGGHGRAALAFGASGAARWSPESPVLHEAEVTVAVGEEVSDTRTTRFGLRTIAVAGDRLLLNGAPYRMRSALVQGFYAGTLYAEPGRDAIVAEVAAAKRLGLNTLRLHIKAFDPVYLDVCDELGMLVHCDIPVAEPIAHAELGAAGEVADRCAAAATEQVRRDRNHPSVVLWSAMNELGLEHGPSRASEGYEGFARRMYAAVTAADPTRPVIENDWVDPDPDRVFASPILTAHWYGRLSTAYLSELAAKTAPWAASPRPFLMSEFGDWGLPSLEPRENAPFWWYGDALGAAIERTPWPRTVAAFVEGTQRYQGLADRLQIELFRRQDGIAGWCVTELTDVPHEFNGLWSLEREAKPAALAELTLACADVLPIVARTSWTVATGEAVELPVSVANDGPALTGVTIEAGLRGRTVRYGPVDLPAHTASEVATVRVPAPEVTGTHELTVRLTGDGVTAVNRYPLHVVSAEPARVAVRLAGDADGLAGAEIVTDGAAPLVVAEGALDAGSGALVAESLSAGRPVLVLAQDADRARHLPVPAELTEVATAWGSTPFLFTTGELAVPALPPATVLSTEPMTIVPDAVWTRLGDGPFPEHLIAGMWKPFPDEIAGAVVGETHVGPGRLLVCQFPLLAAVREGDPMARAVLADLLRHLVEPVHGLRAEHDRLADGRAITYYATKEVS